MSPGVRGRLRGRRRGGIRRSARLCGSARLCASIRLCSGVQGRRGGTRRSARLCGSIRLCGAPGRRGGTRRSARLCGSIWLCSAPSRKHVGPGDGGWLCDSARPCSLGRRRGGLDRGGRIPWRQQVRRRGRRGVARLCGSAWLRGRCAATPGPGVLGGGGGPFEGGAEAGAVRTRESESKQIKSHSPWILLKYR
jgi:hypothetical protein